MKGLPGSYESGLVEWENLLGDEAYSLCTGDNVPDTVGANDHEDIILFYFPNFNLRLTTDADLVSV